LSTDDFFITPEGIYVHEVSKLAEAHRWNTDRALKSFKEGISPIFIDNTNTQAWEAKNYVEFGIRFEYEIKIVEPNTPWKFDVAELVARNTHKVPLLAISAMLKPDITVEIILGSKKPSFTQRRRQTDPPHGRQQHQHGGRQHQHGGRKHHEKKPNQDRQRKKEKAVTTQEEDVLGSLSMQKLKIEN